MEFLVSMTTNVPVGTPERSVDEIREREAARSRELAAEGHLLRLWRPPLQPGEWRTLGLFASGDAEQLERNLASMPLRIWRTDVVTPLLAHPNDPGPSRVAMPRGWGEYLATFTISVPEGTPTAARDDIEAREAARARELSGQGHLARLWRLSRPQAALGLWNAQSPVELQAILASLPLSQWMSVETTSLSPHPSDPVSQES